MSGVQTIKTNPNALIVWLCGEYAIEANQCTDSIFESTILTLIKHYTGIRAPKADQIIRYNIVHNDVVYTCCKIIFILHPPQIRYIHNYLPIIHSKTTQCTALEYSMHNGINTYQLFR